MATLYLRKVPKLLMHRVREAAFEKGQSVGDYCVDVLSVHVPPLPPAEKPAQ